MPQRIDLTTLEDLANLKSNNLMVLFLTSLEEIIKSGDFIVVERRYANAQPDIDSTIKNLEQFEEFKDHWLKAVNNL